MQDRVAIIRSKEVTYPSKYPFPDVEIKEENHVYDAVRESLLMLGLDEDNFGTGEWNPLKDIIKPGQRVVIKPNLVISDHPMGEEGILASVANGAIIRAIVDYVFIALKGEGKITVCDSPIKEVNFNKLIKLLGIDKIQQYYLNNTGVDFDVVDLRDLVAVRNKKNIIVASTKTKGDPLGYKIVQLDGCSFFSGVDHLYKRYRSTAVVYEDVINEYHSPNKHKYNISGTIIESDVIISIAKLKTHQKAGVTLNLKNMVGITNEKRTLPHHCQGPTDNGGDEYPPDISMKKKIYSFLNDIFMRSRYGKYGFMLIMPLLRFLYNTGIKWWRRNNKKDILTGGDWYGNDTIWRTSLDLNQIILYSNKKGLMEDKIQRKYLSIIDGIVGGDKDGPLHPTPKTCGILLVGENPVFTDIAAATIMGFDYKNIPTLTNAMKSEMFNEKSLTAKDVFVKSNISDINDRPLSSIDLNLEFLPSRGWKNFIEDDADNTK